MNKIFIEIPNTTHEMTICVPAEEDVWSFRMIFFESECSDLCMVTIQTNYTNDETEKFQSMSEPKRGPYGKLNREFKFEFKDGPREYLYTRMLKIHIEIFVLRIRWYLEMFKKL